jgi:hypothetical protein
MAPWLTTRVKVLVVLSALALALFLWDSRQPRAPRPQTAGGGPSESVAGKLLQLPPALQQLLATETKPAPKPILSAEARRALEERARGPWGRDPFALEAARPKGQAEVRPSFANNLHVSGIIWDSTRMHAVINDSVVKVGDEVEGIRVVAIERDRVTVAKGDQRQILRLGE